MTIQLETVSPFIDFIRQAQVARELGGGALYFADAPDMHSEAMHKALEDLAWDELTFATD